MAGLLPPRLLLLLYGQNITTTSFPLPLYLICKLQYKVLLLLPSRAEMVVYHILKCLARLMISQSIHPPSFSENHIFSDMEKEKKITFDTSMICFCYDVAIWRAGWVTSDPLFEQEKKPRHFYLSLCVFSLDSFACWGRHHLPWAILAWPIESPKSFCLASKFPHLSGKRAECNLASVCNQVPSVQEFARLAIWHQESPKVIPTQTTKIQKITNA